MKKINLNVTIGILIFLFFVTTLIVGVNKFFSKSKADEGVPLVINFSEGNIPQSSNKSNEKNSNILFNDFTIKVYSTLDNRWLFPNYSFSELLSNNNISLNLSGNNIVDEETFYFDDDINDSSWAYSFTGWHIVGTDSYIPMNTVFQQGNYLDLDNIDKNLFVEKDGVLSLNLEATWGKVYFIQNKYKNMVYSEDNDTGYYYLDDEKSTSLTGANDKNIGNSLNSKLATIDEVYERLRADKSLNSMDPYHTVIMLTGDVDYYKNNGSSKESPNFGFSGKYSSDDTISEEQIRSVTFKSYQKKRGDKYTLNLKPKGYYYNWFGSYRFDNINLQLIKSGIFGSQSIGTEMLLCSKSTMKELKMQCFESTNRFDGDITTFRTGQAKYVVLSGGAYNTFSFGWNGQDYYGEERYWYVTDNANIKNSVQAGYQDSGSDKFGKAYGTVNISVYGGIINSIEGGNDGPYTLNIGDRNIKIKGDGSGNTRYDPKINNVYGGPAQSRIYGNINLTIDNCTNISNVYGGGKDFTSNVYGNILLEINNSVISGNVYGGGYNGNTLKTPSTYKEYSLSNSNLSFVEKDISNLNLGEFSVSSGVGGCVNLGLKNSTVKGNIYGSGFGSSQQLPFAYLNNIQYSQGSNNWITKIGEGTVYPEGWENSYTAYPKYDPVTGYILTGAFKEVAYTSLIPSYISFNTYGTSAYLSLATVENVNILIDNSTVGVSDNLNDNKSGNVYGGGAISKVYENTNIEITNNSIIYGNVYGGGDGSTKPDSVTVYKPIDQSEYKKSSYEILSIKNDNGELIPNVKVSSQKPSYSSSVYGEFNWSGDISLLKSETKGIDLKKKLLYSENTNDLGSVIGNTSVTINENSLINGSVYGGGNAGIVKGDAELHISSSNINGKVYAGGNSSSVKNTKLIVDNNSVISKNVFGGGNLGNVIGNSNVNISDSSINTIYGGGYSGNVLGDSNVIISSGSYKNVYGGGDQGCVNGNTYVNIGLENSMKTTTISGLVYGGGHGYDADGDGDASDFTTVNGNSNVLIQGVNTNVENYGSTKLGLVVGNVDVKFKNYWSGNSTSKYKTMNGIDRATTVIFDNSYVLLENKGTDGKLVGIKAIKNLVIPKGSGLKISTDSEISGDFIGGGELYLDTPVSLTVKGNISGQTTLFLNPKLLKNGSKIIKGGINFPYLKVGGNSPNKIAIVSGEPSKYVIKEADKETVNNLKGENYTYFYISEDVSVDNSIDISSSSEYGRNYVSDISNKKNVYMLNNDIFTTDLDVKYYLTSDVSNASDYTNVNRKLVLVSNTTNKSVDIPKGTEIVMKTKDGYYFYNVDKNNISQISLNDFKNEFGKSFEEVINFETSDSVIKTVNEINGTTSYSLNESYKFIFNFNNTNGISNDSYYPSLEILSETNSFSKVKNDIATNVVNVESRDYELSLKCNKDFYENNGLIKLNGSLKLSSLNSDTKGISKKLIFRLRLKDKDDNYIDIPEGSILNIDGKYYLVKNGVIDFNALSDVNSSAINSDINLSLDMKNVLPQDYLVPGDYSLVFEYLSGNIHHEILKLNTNLISSNDNFGLKVVANAIDDISDDKLKVIKSGMNVSRNIMLSFYNGSELNDMNIKVKAVERTAPFVYSETKNTSNNIVISNNNITTGAKKEMTNIINVKFKGTLAKGTYRIVFELYDNAGNYKTSDYVNFIVN